MDNGQVLLKLSMSKNTTLSVMGHFMWFLLLAFIVLVHDKCVFFVSAIYSTANKYNC